MLRAVVALALLGGCDTVFGFEPVIGVPVACGPYSSVTPVAITGVSEPTNFSITPDGTLAMVVGKDAIGVVRPILLTFDGASWSPDPDPAHQEGLAALAGAHIAPQEKLPNGNTDYSINPISPALIGWSGHPYVVGRYYYSTTAQTWAADVAVGSFSEAENDAIPGNVVVKPNNGDPVLPIRHVPVALHTTTTDASDAIVLTANDLPHFTLTSTPSRTGPLDAHMLHFDQAVLTDDQQAIVYSARADNGSFDIYAAQRDAMFDAGGPVAKLVNTPGADELEPWIDATCSKLYFRRVTVGQSGDPGTIFVAE